MLTNIGCSGGDTHMSKNYKECNKIYKCQKYENYREEVNVSYYPQSINWKDCVDNNFKSFES